MNVFSKHLPLLSNSIPTHSPSLATKLPAYRIVPFSISPRHLTWIRAPGLMLWKKTMDLVSTSCFHVNLWSEKKCKSLEKWRKNRKQTQLAGEPWHSIQNSDWFNYEEWNDFNQSTLMYDFERVAMVNPKIIVTSRILATRQTSWIQ